VSRQASKETDQVQAEPQDVHQEKAGLEKTWSLSQTADQEIENVQ
jgi:hypothetical protein